MIKKHAKNIYKNKFFKCVLIVASGTALSQLISIAFSPILTRLYSPEAFGVLGAFNSLTAILVPIVALSYPIAIILPKDDLEALGVAKLSFSIALILTAVITVFLIIGGDSLLKIFALEGIPAIIYIIPVFLLVSTGVQIGRQWLIRKKQFMVTANASVLQYLGIGTTKVGLGFIYPVSLTLILLTTISEAFHVFLLWLGIRKVGFEHSRNDVSTLNLRDLAKKYKDFPLFRTPEVTITALAHSLPPLFLISFFGPASAGFYALGKKIMALPSRLISKSVGDVFYPHITEAAHKGKNLTRLILKSTLVLAGVGFIPYAIVILFGPWLFSFVFGPEWYVAGEYARWLSVWLYFGFLNNPSIKALPVLKAQKFHLIYSTILIFIRLGTLVFGFYFYKSDLVAIALYSVSGAVFNIVLIIIVFFIAKKYDSQTVAAVKNQNERI